MTLFNEGKDGNKIVFSSGPFSGLDIKFTKYRLVSF
jgi:hypothetical protein